MNVIQVCSTFLFTLLPSLSVLNKSNPYSHEVPIFMQIGRVFSLVLAV